MNREPKFKFYEVVVVVSQNPALRAIAGQTGGILGRSSQNGEKWQYAVHILDSGKSWSIDEIDVAATGMQVSRDDFYDGSSIKVIVDRSTGKGRFADPTNPL